MGFLRRKAFRKDGQRYVSPYWFACFRSPDGSRWLQRSTKSAKRGEATRIMLEWEGASTRGITEAQARKVLSDIHEMIHQEPLSSSTLRGYAKGWLARKKLETADGTYPVYLDAVNQFVAHLRTRADGPIAFVTTQHVIAFRDAVAAQSSAITANKKLRIVRNLLGSAWRDGFVTENPAAKVQAMTADSKRRRPFTLGEIKSLMAVANTEWRGLILAGLYTGQRLGDLARLSWSQIDLAKSEVCFRTGKTDRTVNLPLAKSLADYLTSLDAPDDPQAPVFPNTFETLERTGLVGNLSNRFAKILHDANLGPKRTHAKKAGGKGRGATREASGLSFHCLRHTCTTLLKIAGVPQAVVMDFVGHDSAAVSANYTHIDDEAKRAAVAKLPDLGN